LGTIEVTEKTLVHSLNVTELVGELVAAYVSNNSVPIAELPGLIAKMHTAIAGLASGTPGISREAAAESNIEKLMPAQIRKSVRDDGITSFIDGKTYKTLKRHLSAHGLDPRSYRERYGLPADYPMVAPSYAATRSALAKAIGLGRPGARQPEEEPAEEAPPKPKGRRKA
jgi:predicted transcriptional regulator